MLCNLQIRSLANPWLDFLPAAEARTLASKLNDDMQDVCASKLAQGRLFAFGALPTLDADGCVAEVRRLATLPHMRGVIMGTSGLGRGLDDERLTPLWAALEETGLTVFLHPHYGVGNEHFHATGHALALALGFPFETSVAVSRLIVSGRLEQFPRLRMLLAHSGGTLPYLVGRLDSCVAHDLALAARLPHAPSFYLRRLYFDALSYHLPTLQALIQFAGADRVVFGTGTPSQILHDSALTPQPLLTLRPVHLHSLHSIFAHVYIWYICMRRSSFLPSAGRLALRRHQHCYLAIHRVQLPTHPGTGVLTVFNTSRAHSGWTLALILLDM
jgi:predicted TIM-barrel fold metal-dependent hydrolase